jgi:hypothetical protein
MKYLFITIGLINIVILGHSNLFSQKNTDKPSPKQEFSFQKLPVSTTEGKIPDTILFKPLIDTLQNGTIINWTENYAIYTTYGTIDSNKFKSYKEAIDNAISQAENRSLKEYCISMNGLKITGDNTFLSSQVNCIVYEVPLLIDTTVIEGKVYCRFKISLYANKSIIQRKFEDGQTSSVGTKTIPKSLKSQKPTAIAISNPNGIAPRYACNIKTENGKILYNSSNVIKSLADKSDFPLVFNYGEIDNVNLSNYENIVKAFVDENGDIVIENKYLKDFGTNILNNIGDKKSLDELQNIVKSQNFDKIAEFIGSLLSKIAPAYRIVSLFCPVCPKF